MSSQSSVFPLEPDLELPERTPRAIDLFTEEGGRMLEALQSTMARAILAELVEEPGTTSDLADRVGTSLQNAHYHLDHLDEAGLITVVGTHYSCRGTEMKVYALDGAPLVLVGGGDDTLDVTADQPAPDAAERTAANPSD